MCNFLSLYRRRMVGLGKLGKILISMFEATIWYSPTVLQKVAPSLGLLCLVLVSLRLDSNSSMEVSTDSISQISTLGTISTKLSIFPHYFLFFIMNKFALVSSTTSTVIVVTTDCSSHFLEATMTFFYVIFQLQAVFNCFITLITFELCVGKIRHMLLCHMLS